MQRCMLLVAAATLMVSAPAGAWGPHTEITRAALDTLPSRDRVEERLGTLELQRYSWLPDYRDATLPDYSPNDYLIFPDHPAHSSHLLPEVRRTYRPFLRRAIQALHTESRTQAARWTGALLHFVQDSGSPPHAEPTAGMLHFRMENWVDATAIRLPGYRPRRLAESGMGAEAALEQRMEAVIRVARDAAQRARLPAEQGREEATRAAVLPAALESARVSADLLHTILRLPEPRPEDTSRLEILVRAPRLAPRVLAPARLELLDSPYSTWSDAITEATADYYRGRLWLRGLPPRRYRLRLTRPGSAAWTGEVELQRGKLLRLEVSLAAATAEETRPNPPSPGSR